MPDRIILAVQKVCIMMATLIFAVKNTESVVVHAAVNLQGEQSEFLQLLFQQMDLLLNCENQDSKTISQTNSEVASTQLQITPSVTIKGNITDHERRLTITFTVQASRSDHNPAATADDEEEEDAEEEDDWRCSSGVLTPIVDAVEPYFLSFVELVFNGILSTVISNFLEGTSLLGDVRLV